MAWQGEQHSRVGGVSNKEIPRSLCWAKGQHPHHSMQWSHSASCWMVKRSGASGKLHKFLCCVAQIEGWVLKNTQSRKDEGFLPWTATSYPCRKANFRGLKKGKKKKKLNTTNCCHWTWLCSKVCQGWDWLGCMVSRKQSAPSAGYKAILIVLLPPWQPYWQPRAPGETGCSRGALCLYTTPGDAVIQAGTTLLRRQKGPNLEKERKSGL